jgi:hypothetical protein
VSLVHFLKNFLFEGSSFLIDEFLNTEWGVYFIPVTKMDIFFSFRAMQEALLNFQWSYSSSYYNLLQTTHK